jgi:hypothetical protein
VRQIKLGRSELSVSRLAFGTWQLGGDWGATDEQQAVAAIRRAADEGVTLFDTAQAYGFGASERLLAKALEGRSREAVVLATKGGLRPAGKGVVRDASPAWIREGVEQSLLALGTEYIDQTAMYFFAGVLLIVLAVTATLALRRPTAAESGHEVHQVGSLPPSEGPVPGGQSGHIAPEQPHPARSTSSMVTSWPGAGRRRTA